MNWNLISLLLRNLFFTILQPGIVVGLVPYWILKNAAIDFPSHWTLLHCIGLIVFIPGLFIMLKCILQFAFEGKGTLSPADPTKHLVVKGLYKYSRNPMYIGVLLILLGEWIFFQLHAMLIYTFLIFILFNLFILFVEEPRLKKDFKNDYEVYCKKVRRWI